MQFKWYFNSHFLKLLNKAISFSFCGWICFKLNQRVPRYYIFPNYNLNHPNPLSVAGGTAGSVFFDGHQYHQWTVAPAALDQMVRFLCISCLMTPIYNARYIFF